MNELAFIDYELIVNDGTLSGQRNEQNRVELSLKKNRRFYSIGTQHGIQSAKNILSRLPAAKSKVSHRIGLYCTQFGYLHPNCDDFIGKIETSSLKTKEELFYFIWNSHKINPFLVTLSLSNNLLGLASQELGVKFDCASFLRGNIGLLAAFQEAKLALNSQRVEYALVMASGLYKHVNKGSYKTEGKEFGVSFMLKRNSIENKYLATLDPDILCNRYQFGEYRLEDLAFIKMIISLFRL